MIPHYTAAYHRVALLIGAFLCTCSMLTAQTLNWNGNSTATLWSTSANWSPNTSLGSGTTWDLVATNTSDSNPMVTMTAGGNYTIRSLSIDNAAQLFNNATSGLRFVSTTVTNSTAARTISFGTADITIINLTNSANLNVNSSTLTSNVGTPSMTLNLNFSGNGTINTDATSQLTVTGANAIIAGTGGLIKDGDGTLRLSGNHTYSGGFVLETGKVVITTSGSNNTSAVTASPWGTGTLILRGGTLDSSSNNGRTVRNNTVLDGNITISTSDATSGNYTWSTGAGQSTTLASNSTLNITQTVNWTQNISGGFGLTKTGTGTLVINGTSNTYTGTTTLAQGTLRIDTSIAGALDTAAGTTLQGSGTVGGAAIIAGIHNPGNSPGIQTFDSDLTYNTGASVNWELNGNTSTQGDPTAIFDQVVVGDTLNFAGSTSLALSFNGAGSTVDWSDAFWSANQSWKIYDAAAVSGFGNLSLTTANWADASGDLFDTILAGSSFSLSVVGTDVYLNYAAIPEPATYAALFGLAGLALVAWRRRAQQG